LEKAVLGFAVIDQPEETDKIDGEKSKPWLFKPGQVANPLGRPKGSRNKLGEDFIRELQADFHANGKAAIEEVRKDRPHEYLKVIASLLPKQVEIKEGAFDGLSDEQLSALVAAARSALGIAEGGGTGAVN
jgi:hypothetical protein